MKTHLLHSLYFLQHHRHQALIALVAVMAVSLLVFLYSQVRLYQIRKHNRQVDYMRELLSYQTQRDELVRQLDWYREIHQSTQA